MELRQILERINEVRKADFEDNQFDWDGTLSFNGIKRMVYGLWNDGKTEDGSDMIRWMSPTARRMYRELMEEVENDKIEITKPC